MKNKILPDHILPYLPYGLKSAAHASSFGLKKPLIIDINTNNVLSIMDGSTLAKPILKKLDLYSLIEETNISDDAYYLRNFLAISFNIDSDINSVCIEYYPYGVIQWLLKNHYDIFGLIEKELAVDFDTLTQ